MAIASPLELAACTIWLDVSQESYAVGAAIGQITDRSGNGNHATQADTAKRPTLELEPGSGLAAARWEFGDQMRLPDYRFETSRGTTFVVGRHDGNGTDFFLSSTDLGGGFPAPNRHRWYLSVTSGAPNVSIGRSVFDVDADWSLSFPKNRKLLTLSLRSDGTTGRATSSCTRPRELAFPEPYAGTGQTVFLGGYSGQPESSLEGLICEVIHYDRTLSDLEVDDVDAYLRSKWAIRCSGFTVGRIGIGSGLG